MEGLAGHGDLPTAAAGGGMLAVDLLGPAADAGTVTEEGYFIFVQQLVVCITGAAATAPAAGGGGIWLPTSSSVQEGASAVVDVTIDGLASATTHGNAIVSDDDAGDDKNVRRPSSSSGGGGGTRSTSRSRTRRSVVWEHMEVDPSGNEASCRYCTKTLSARTRGGTSHLRRHVNRCALRQLARALDI
uniref:BED-type domain-containing protein n=1 Tax=Oryza meridionalis TaxID=40149 RepID=A0A0E0C2L2_9ORYZ